MAEEARLSQEQLSAFWDGELSPSEAAEVERRLQTDSLAQRELAELTVVSRLLARSVAPALPRDYRFVMPRTRPWRRLFDWAPALAATAAVALIALGAVGAVTDQGRVAPDPAAQSAPSRGIEVESTAMAEDPGPERAVAAEFEATAAAIVAAAVERDVAAEAVPEASAASAVSATREIATEAVPQASTVSAAQVEHEVAAETIADATASPPSAASAAPPADARGTAIDRARATECAPPPSMPGDELETAADATRPAVIPAASAADAAESVAAALESPATLQATTPPTAIRPAGVGVSSWTFALGGGLTLLLSSIVWAAWRRRRRAGSAA